MRYLSIVSLLILFSGCLETDGNLKSSGSLSSVSSIGAGDLGAGFLPSGVLLSEVAQLPSPLNGSLCSSGQILEWSGSNWLCINTSSGGGSPGNDSVNSSTIVNGSILGEDIQNSSIDATLKMITSCGDNQILQASGGGFICANQGVAGDDLGSHIATQGVQLDGNWLSNDGGNEGIFIDTAGFVGLGTSTPLKRLHVVSDSGNPAFFETVGVNNTAQAGFAILKTVTGGAPGDDGIGSGIYFRTVDGAGNQRNIGGVVGVYDDASPGSYARRVAIRAGGQTIQQIAGGSVGLHVLDTGSVGVGTNNPSHLLHVTGVARATQSTWATSSDKRVKENILSIENGLEYISNLNPVTFNYKKSYIINNQGPESLQYGFIAQEVKEILPEAVEIVKETVGNEIISDFHVLNTASFMALVVSSIKSLKGSIEELFDRLNFSVTRLQALERKNESLFKENIDLKKRILRLEEKIFKK